MGPSLPDNKFRGQALTLRAVDVAPRFPDTRRFDKFRLHHFQVLDKV